MSDVINASTRAVSSNQRRMTWWWLAGMELCLARSFDQSGTVGAALCRGSDRRGESSQDGSVGRGWICMQRAGGRPCPESSRRSRPFCEGQIERVTRR